MRELAQSFDLPNQSRPDSQGLCFLGKVKFDEFLGAYLGNKGGDVVDASTGDVIGHHLGLWFHTVGQRKGIGKVLHPKATAKGPWYVVAKDPTKNIVFVSNTYDEDAFATARSEFYVDDVSWISTRPSQPEGGGLRLNMKIRHGPTIVQGVLYLDHDEEEEEKDHDATTNEEDDDPTKKSNSGRVLLEEKDGGLAPGQFVAFYNTHDDECLGSGVISERHWASFLLHHQDVLDGKKEKVS